MRRFGWRLASSEMPGGGLPPTVVHLSRLFAVAVVVSLVLSGPAAAAPIRTLLLGDSITFGIVSGGTAPAYAEILAADLAGSHDVVNASMSGSSAFYWAPSTPCPGVCSTADNLFDELATPELPADIVTVLLGTNDALAFLLDEPTPLGDYEDLMREIVDGIFAGGASDVILMTPPRGNIAPAPATLLAGYREGIALICEDTFGVLCGPDLHELLDPALDFAFGDIHPNAAGHAKIAAALADAILSIPEPRTGLLLCLGFSALSIRPLRRTCAG